MLFSESRAITLRPRKEKRLSTFFAALITAAAFFVPYMALSEGYFIFFGDFNVQQIPFYKLCHAAIKSGNIGWSTITDLGANFIGSYSFYLLGSPFFWLTIPFPNSFVPYLMGPLLILKFACAALTAYCYLRRFTKTPEAARLGGLLYAFSGFSVYNVFFNHFHEPIIVFPLLLLALELFLTENRRGCFALAVALSAVVNYFFFFGMAVFCIIYFFVRVCSGAVKLRFPRFLALLFEAVIGVGVSAFLLLPSVLAILGNGRISQLQLFNGWNAIMYGKEQIYLNIIECFFFPPDLPARPVFFPGADVKWSSLGGWLPVFSMAGVFTWFSSKRGSWQKRLIGICAFMAMVPVLNSAFYAFNTSYYARWFYMPILIMCLVTAILSEEQTADWKTGWRWTFGITLAFALTIGFFPQKDTEAMKNAADPEKLILKFGLYTPDSENTYMYRFWATAAIAVLGLIVLRLLLGEHKRNRNAFICSSTALVCVFSVIYGNVFIATGRSHSYEIKDVMIDRMIEGKVDLDYDGTWRIDVYDGVDNTGMYLGLPSINSFHSIVPASIMNFYKYVGESRDVASRPSTENSALRPLLAVKYLLNRTDGDRFENDDGEAQMPGWEYVKTSGGYYIYENKNYVPYGVSYDYYMTKDFCDGYSEKTRANLMLKAVLLTDEQIKKYGGNMKNLADAGYYNSISDYETDGSLTEQTGENTSAEGNSSSDSDGVSDISDTSGGTGEKLPEVTLSLSDDALTSDSARLRATAAESFTEGKSRFTAKVTRESASLVYFQIPYDEGWSVTVNGKKADIEQVNVGFMAVPVEKGTSEIVFSYETPGLYSGILITAGSFVVLVMYLLIWFAASRRRPPVVEYPEGDRLLREWRADDIAEARLAALGKSEEEPRSILDDDPIEIPNPDGGFFGGFKIDDSVFEDLGKEAPPTADGQAVRPGEHSSDRADGGLPPESAGKSDRPRRGKHEI